MAVTRLEPEQMEKLWSSGQKNKYLDLVLQVLRKGGELQDTALRRAFDYAFENGNDEYLNQYVPLVKEHFPRQPWPYQMAAKFAEWRGDWREALQALRQAEALGQPDIVKETRVHQANVHQRLHEPENALALLAKTDIPDSMENEAWLVRAQAWKSLNKEDRLFEDLEPWLTETASDARLVSAAWKLLGRAYDKHGDYESAFRCFERGNAMMSRLEGYPASENAIRRGLEARRRLLTPDWVRQWTTAPEPDQTPVFVVGFPRSGTTLLGQVLDAHPTVSALDEPQALTQVRKWLNTYGHARALQQGRLHKQASWIDKQIEVVRGFATVSSEQVQTLRQIYMDRIKADGGATDAGQILVDENPLNSANIDLIYRIFPHARIVFVARHPLDCIISGYMNDFELNPAMRNFLHLRDAGVFYRQYMRVFWQSVDAFGLRDQLYCIRYEDLVEDFQGTMSGLLDFIGPGWSDEVQQYHARARGLANVRTPSYEDVTKPIYGASVSRWRNYAHQLEPILDLVEEGAERFGYSLAVSDPTGAPESGDVAAADPGNA